MQINNSKLSVNQEGNALVTIILAALLILSLIFGFWAYGGMLDYKNNVDKKIADANAIVKQQVSSEKDKQYAEQEKSPYKTYNGSATYGSVSFQYPKTWSAYINDSLTNSSDTPINSYFSPGFVPSIDSKVAFALRFKVMNKTYDDALHDYQDSIATGKIKATPFRAANVQKILGIRLDGPVLDDSQKDSVVLLPIRDKTLQIWTESNQYLADFNNTILPSLNFSP